MRKIKSQRLLSLLVALFLFVQQAFSQTSVTGTVVDQQGMKGIPNVSVTLKGTNVATLTDNNGVFRINAPTNGTLVFSSVGYGTLEVPINGKNTVDATMVSTNSNLSEVVVIGYGTARRRDITGSVSTVSSKEFNSGVVTSPDQLLQNKVSGLEIVNNSGQPGTATTVKIRGNTSIRGAGNPIYVVDGVILDGRNARPSLNLGTGGFGTTPDANPLLYINPYDIQDITILKDASSTAIYGSRGANGVIVITTKKGTAGPMKLEAGISEGWNVGYMKKYDVLSQSEFKSALVRDSVNGQDKGGNVNPLNDIVQHTTIQNYNLAMSGGNANGKFRASFLASRTPGFIKTNNLDKYVGTFSGNYKFLNNKLNIDFSLISGHTKENIVLVSNTAGSQGNLVSAALQWNPTQTYYNSDGTFFVSGNGVGNPFSLLKAYNDVAYVNTVLGSISASYKILNNLDYKFLYSINQSDGTRNTNVAGFLRGFNPIDGNGLGVISKAGLTSQIYTHTLNYRTALGSNLNLDALGGFEYWKSDFNNANFSALGFNFNLNEKQLVNADYTDVLQNGNSQFQPSVFRDITTEVQSYFARASLNFRNKYYLTGTFRADGSSKFGANNKYGYFPSVGAKWDIGNEDFMKGSNVFSNLGLRATWGITGSQEFPAGASIDQFSFGAFNSASQINVGNPNLKWEQTDQYDLGLDFGFMNNRINGSVDYYNKSTTNILFQSITIQPGPAATYWINLPGHLINNGVEVTIGGRIIENSSVQWNLNLNMAYNHNIIKDFYAPGSKNVLSIYTGQINGQGVSGTLGQIITNNQPVDEFYLKKFTGFDRTGNQTYEANPSFAGNPNPTTLFGGTSTLAFKKLVFTISGGGAAGFLIYNNTATSVTNIAGLAQGRNIDKNANISPEKKTSPVAANSRFLESGNFFKLRSANLTYNIGNVGKYLKDLNVYVSGSNLFVITKFSGFDPEVNIDKSQAGYPSRSIEYIPYPTPRSVVLGLNFSL